METETRNLRGVEECPWYSWSEWESVVAAVYNVRIEERRWAVGRLNAWKARVRKLPTGIGATLCLLDADLQQHLPNESERTLKLCYSTAIIRFINFVTELGMSLQGGKGKNALDKVAEQLGLPAWLVDIRNEATHGTIPATPTLKHAITIALNWLKSNYWDIERECMVEISPSQYGKFQQTLEKAGNIVQTSLNSLITELLVDSDTEDHRSKLCELQQTLQAKITRAPGAAVKSLVSGQCPMLSKLLLDKCCGENFLLPVDTPRPPPELSRVCVPLLRVFYKSHMVPTLAVALAECSHNLEPTSRWLSCMWLYLIASESGGSAVDWRTVLHKVLAVPNTCSMALLQVLKPLVADTMSESKLQLLEATLAAYLGNTRDNMRLGPAPNTVHTVDEAKCKAQVMDTEGEGDWTLCHDIEWSSIPLGVCPSQLNCKQLNLEMDPRLWPD